MKILPALLSLLSLLALATGALGFDTVVTTPPDSIESLRAGINDSDYTYEVGAGVQLNLNGPELPGSPQDARFDALFARDGGELNYAYQISPTDPGITAQNIFAEDGGVVNFLAGQTLDLTATDGGIARVSGGYVTFLHAETGGSVELAGGVAESVFAVGGELKISGGLTDFLYAQGSKVTMSGGRLFATHEDSLGMLFVGGGELTIEAGDVRFQNIDFASLGSDSSLSFLGSGFAIDGEPIAGLPIGEPIEVAARDALLSGFLTDGSPFAVRLLEDSYGAGALNVFQGGLVTVTLAVPEPAATCLVMCGIFTVSVLRKRGPRVG